MIDPPRWSAEQLQKDSEISTEYFRKLRMEESLADYVEHFDLHQGDVEELFETTIDLTSLDATALDVLTNKRLLEAFRYLAGPPVSIDDWKTIAEAKSLTAKALRADAELLRRVVQVIVAGLDRRRFPWVSEGREPTEAERNAAIIASSAMMTMQRISTNRRTEGKELQESRVETALADSGFVKVKTREVKTFADAPAPGEFCGESLLGNRKADFIVRLWDNRTMPLECKVSNSSTNSVKRLNNDAAIKAEIWRKDFGATQVVPAAVLSGVYKLHNLQEAQERGLALFWAHDLKTLTDWIEQTRNAGKA
jgi:hypothetical protein